MRIIMNTIKITFVVIITTVLFLNNSFADSNYFKDGEKLFNEKKYLKSKFQFERDIVFNPKSEFSYLYLAKIFKQQDKDNLQEQNLNTVLLLNPKNEEAIFLLALLKIEKSDFGEAEKLIKTFKKICKTTCGKEAELENKLKNSQLN
tara:strand:- start:124 stop:564 length:441 start_codon:yes stop_codon:yes gene_type:complete